MKSSYFIIVLVFIGTSSFCQSKDMGNCNEFVPQREITAAVTDIPYPNNFICHVVTNRKKRFWFGSKADAATFTLLSPKALIGAYHSIMQIGSKIRSIDIDIYAHEENGKEFFLKRITLNRNEFSLIKPFKNKGKKNDCGLILLNSPIVGLKGNFPKIATVCHAKNNSQIFHLNGYPYEENDIEYNGSKLFERDISFVNTTFNDNLIYYPCVKSSVGDSGGPLWVIIEKEAYIFGTHVGGNANNYDSIWGECFDDEKVKILTDLINFN